MAKKLKKYQSLGEVKEAANARRFAIADSTSKARYKAMIGDTIPTIVQAPKKGEVKRVGSTTIKPMVKNKKGGQTKSKKK